MTVLGVRRQMLPDEVRTDHAAGVQEDQHRCGGQPGALVAGQADPHPLVGLEVVAGAQPVADLLDQDVVLVCRSGMRAAQAEATLAGAGLPNVHLLEGGITAWQQHGAPVTRGRARWDIERQVRLVAGSIVFVPRETEYAVKAGPEGARYYRIVTS